MSGGAMISQVLAPLPIGLAVFVVHLATIPITGCGINPARSFGPAALWNHQQAWDDQWIFWVGPSSVNNNEEVLIHSRGETTR
ncbi:hypothetical protein AXG93_402s1090 [Marchantia polymorpha subsp. ruderalis]|uniref:Aquaporin n=1 Tax=Marchantia polymorpha subsp. ruderalis TaxID=1480154 RepID=A0A176WEY1_MARPO|nr:hypothetical protein AXG93_402s1090 [Marchantia polymorpha subsp. ruderalis]